MRPLFALLVAAVIAPAAAQDVAPLPAPGVYVGLRPEREFWETIRHAADMNEAVVRLNRRYGPFPIEFPGFVALGIRPDPVNEATGMPAVLVDVVVKVGPASGRHTRPVWFSPMRYHWGPA